MRGKTTPRQETLHESIVNLAKVGNKPSKIESSLHYVVDRKYIAAVLSKARKTDRDVPRFSTNAAGKKSPERRVIVIPPASVTACRDAGLDYFELRALKKLLGAHREQAEREADQLGVSLQVLCTHLLRKHLAAQAALSQLNGGADGHDHGQKHASR